MGFVDDMKAAFGDDVVVLTLPRTLVCGPPCMFCGYQYGIEVAPDETAAEYMMGGRAENLTFWNDLPMDQREVLISGTDPACWDRFMRGDDE